MPEQPRIPRIIASLRAVHPLRWQLWRLRHRVVIFLVVWEVLAVAAAAWGVTAASRPTVPDWLGLAALAACSTFHIQITRKQDERRRNKSISAVYVDLTAIWLFPAVLLLPFHLALFLIILVDGQRWFNWRRPPHRFFFSLCTNAVAVLSASQVFMALSPSGLATASPQGSTGTFGAIVLAGLVYELVQIIGVGSVIALSSSSTPRLRNVLGSPADNAIDLTTIGLGAVTAVLLVHIPAAIVIVLVVSILGNKLAEISQLQEEAKTDVKTGLLNMRGWTEAANRAFARTTRSGSGPALLMIDLDHFKWINDTYGHPAGDDVILQVGRLIGKAIRPSDIVGRFGGEEFVVLLTDTSRTVAAQVSERIRHAIASALITTTGRRGAPVTITDRTTSIGVAVYPDHGSTLQDLLHAADAAVYEAKEHGRDQVRFATGNSLPSDAPPIEVRHS